MRVWKAIPTIFSSKIRILFIAIFIVGMGIFIYFLVTSGNNGLTKSQIKENKEIAERMSANYTPSKINNNLYQEIQSSIDNNDYEKAKNQLYDLLNIKDITDSDKETTYGNLDRVCIKLKDLSCSDKVVDYMNSVKRYNYYFLVDMAKIAKELNNNAKSQKYYAVALKDIDANGGEEFLNKLTEATTPLSYAEIKSGASQ